jgi:DNA-binding transcriptional LysR family regulator
VLPLVIAFAQRHPDLRPHLSLSDRFVDLVDDGIDVAVRIGEADVWPAALGFRHLATERLVFCAAPAYLARRGTPRSLDHLMRHDAVLYGRADGSAAPWSVRDGDGPVARRSVVGRMTIGNAEAQVAAVRAGCGVAQLATWLIAGELARGELVQFLPQLATGGLPLYLVWQKSRQLVPKVAALLEMLAATLQID